jgi:hypothetical protein
MRSHSLEIHPVGAAHPLEGRSARTGIRLALALAVLAAPGAAHADPQSTDQQRCTNAMNLNLLRTTGAIGGEVLGCLGAGGGGSSIEACSVADADEKLAKARDKTASDFAKRCTGVSRRPPNLPKLPPYGATDVDTVNAAAAGAYDLFHDVLGIDLDRAAIAADADAAGAACQQLVAKEVRACQVATLREFNLCKKLGLADDDAPFASAADIARCFGQDPKGKIAKRCDLRDEIKPGKFKVDAIRKQLAKKCVAKRVDLARAFPGCGSADAEATHACLERATRCRACLSVDRADGLVLDCDLADDGLANASCAPPLGAHACEFDSESGFLFESAAGFLGGELAGRIDIECGSVDADTGSAPCRCELDDLEPVEVPSVGWTCLSAVPGCASGRASCTGATSLDFVLSADHDVGACTGNAGCAEACEAVCGASGAEVWDSGCEGFCEGGTGDGASCTSDASCGGGRCNGIAGGAHGNVCQCQCIDLEGAPSEPGGLRCEIGTRIRIEASLPCDGADVLLDLGDRCLPITTESAQARLVDRDHVPGRMLPSGTDLTQGTPVSCEALASQGAAGTVFVSAANAFDVPQAGDVYLLFGLGCE